MTEEYDRLVDPDLDRSDGPDRYYSHPEKSYNKLYDELPFPILRELQKFSIIQIQTSNNQSGGQYNRRAHKYGYFSFSSSKRIWEVHVSLKLTKSQNLLWTSAWHPEPWFYLISLSNLNYVSN